MKRFLYPLAVVVGTVVLSLVAASLTWRSSPEPAQVARELIDTAHAAACALPAAVRAGQLAQHNEQAVGAMSIVCSEDSEALSRSPADVERALDKALADGEADAKQVAKDVEAAATAPSDASQ